MAFQPGVASKISFCILIMIMLSIMLSTICYVDDNNFIFTPTFTLEKFKGCPQNVVIICGKNFGNCKKKYFQIQPKWCPEQPPGQGFCQEVLHAPKWCAKTLLPGSQEPKIPASSLPGGVFLRFLAGPVARKLFLANGKRQGEVLGEPNTVKCTKFINPYKRFFH